MKDYIGGYIGDSGMPSLTAIASMISGHRTKRLRDEAGITSINGFEGIERLGIPHEYTHIEIGGKYFTCLSSDKKTIYTKEGKLLFRCTDYRYYKQGMFLVGNSKDMTDADYDISNDFGYALYNEENKLTDQIFRPHGMSEHFNESGFVILSVYGKFSEKVIVNKSGDIVFQSNSFKSPYLKGIIVVQDDVYTNLLTGNVICKRSYATPMDTNEFTFVQVDSNCIYQININNGDFIIHGEEKKVEEPKKVEPVAKTEEPKKIEQRRNDQCACGSGKKYKNCCLGKSNK